MILSVLHWLRLLVAWVDLVLFSVVMYGLAWVPGVSGGPIYHRAFRYWAQIFVRALGVKLMLHEKNLNPLPDNFILIANHPSAFEDIGIPALFDVHSVAKHEVAHWWIAGRISRAAGTLYVKRESKESRNAVAQQMLDELAGGKNIAIYPEGGCKGKRIYERFLYGAFDASIKSGVPILPVFLHYEAQDTFEWRDPQTLIHKIWHFMTASNPRANYYVYDAMYPADFEDKEHFSSAAREKYLEWQKEYLE